MRCESDFWQTRTPTCFKTQWPKAFLARSVLTTSQVLPIWAGPGGGVVRGDGGDWSHRQRPLGGGHREGAHHGGRTRPPPLVCCRLPQRGKRRTDNTGGSECIFFWLEVAGVTFSAEQFNVESQRLPKYNSGRQVAPFFQNVFSTFLHKPAKYVNQQNQNRV